MSPGYDGDPKGALSITKHPTLYWACPDIWVGQPGGTTAGPGHNVVGVRFSYDESLVVRPFNAAAVEVYVFDPSLAPPPGAFRPGGSAVYALPGQVVGVDEFGSSGAVAQVDFDIPPPPAADPHDIVAGNSHRCLIARVFPNGSSTPSEFDVSDVHEAQRNIFIVGATGDKRGPSEAGAGFGGVGTPAGKLLAPARGWWTFVVNAWAGADDVESQTVVVDIVLDVDPTIVEGLLGEVLAELEIERVENLESERAGLVVGEWDPVHGGESAPEITMQMAPRSRVPVGVLANLSRKRSGTAYAVHVRQSVRSDDGRTLDRVGGATVLFHRADRKGG